MTHKRQFHPSRIHKVMHEDLATHFVSLLCSSCPRLTCPLLIHPAIWPCIGLGTLAVSSAQNTAPVPPCVAFSGYSDFGSNVTFTERPHQPKVASSWNRGMLGPAQDSCLQPMTYIYFYFCIHQCHGVPWKQSYWDYLHHGQWQKPQGTAVFSSLESWLLNIYQLIAYAT